MIIAILFTLYMTMICRRLPTRGRLVLFMLTHSVYAEWMMKIISRMYELSHRGIAQNGFTALGENVSALGLSVLQISHLLNNLRKSNFRIAPQNTASPRNFMLNYCRASVP